jgi:hypothetical protein
VVRDSLARLKVNGVANASGGRNGSDTECVQVLGLKFGVVVHTRIDGVVVKAGGLGNLLTSSKGYRVANASGGREGSDTECVQVLGLEFGVVVHTRVDCVVVQAGRLRDLLTSSEGYRVTCAGGGGDWVDGERLLFVVAEGCRSLGECAGNILFVFEGLSAGETGGAVVCQWV